MLDSIFETIKERLGDAWMLPEPLAMRLFFIVKKKFYMRVRVLSSARTPFSDAVREMKQSAYRAKNGLLYAALNSIDHRLSRGRSIDEAMTGWIPQEERMLLSAGDRRGYTGFAEAIDQIMELNEASGKMVTIVIAGLFEPVVIVTSMYILIIWMAQNFTEKVIKLTRINPDQLSGQARQFYDVGVFASTKWALLAPISVIAVILLMIYSMPRWTKPLGMRKIADKMPPYSIYRAIVGARWMMAFATLGMANIPYEVIFSETAKLSSPWLQIKLEDILRLYRRGVGLGNAFLKSGHQFPSKSLCEDLVFFGDRPEFERILLILSKEWVKSTTRLVQTMSQALTAMGYALIGFGMLWVLSAFQATQSQITAIVQQIH